MPTSVLSPYCLCFRLREISLHWQVQALQDTGDLSSILSALALCCLPLLAEVAKPTVLCRAGHQALGEKPCEYVSRLSLWLELITTCLSAQKRRVCRATRSALDELRNHYTAVLTPHPPLIFKRLKEATATQRETNTAPTGEPTKQQ